MWAQRKRQKERDLEFKHILFSLSVGKVLTNSFFSHLASKPTQSLGSNLHTCAQTPSILTTPNRRTKSQSSRSHNADGSLTAGVTQADDAAGTLVERGQTSTQVGWVAGIGRHLSQTTGDFSQGLSPSGSGVSHHGDVETHVTEILGQRDPCSTISPSTASLNRVMTGTNIQQKVTTIMISPLTASLNRVMTGTNIQRKVTTITISPWTASLNRVMTGTNIQRKVTTIMISPLTASLNRVTTDGHKNQTHGYNQHNHFPWTTSLNRVTTDEHKHQMEGDNHHNNFLITTNQHP